MVNPVLQQIMLYVGGWFAIVFFMLFIFDFLSGGFILTWVRVRLRKRTSILVRVFSLSGVYYKKGKIENGTLIFKDRHKHVQRLHVQKKSVYESFRVYNVEVLENRGSVRLIDYNKVLEGLYSVPGFDAEQFDGLVKKALTLPQIGSKREKWLLLLVIAAAGLSVICIYMVYGVQQDVNLLLEAKNAVGVVV